MSVEKQLKEIDNAILAIKESDRIARTEINRILNEATNSSIMRLQFKKMNLVYEEYRLQRLVHFCNTNKFEY